MAAEWTVWCVCMKAEQDSFVDGVPQSPTSPNSDSSRNDGNDNVRNWFSLNWNYDIPIATCRFCRYACMFEWDLWIQKRTAFWSSIPMLCCWTATLLIRSSKYILPSSEDLAHVRDSIAVDTVLGTVGGQDMTIRALHRGRMRVRLVRKLQTFCVSFY